MHKGFGTNQYGTRVSLHNCDACGEDFTLCPAQTADWTCNAPDCPDYDRRLDVDVLLKMGAVLLPVPKRN